MIDLMIDKEGDLSLIGADFRWVDGTERVRQQLQIKLQLWQGEWFLNTEFGTPYLSQILGKQVSLQAAIAALKRSILDVEGVQDIQEFSYTVDRHSRQLNAEFTVTTPYGLIEYKGNT